MRNEYKSSAQRARENLAQVVELLGIFHHEEALRAAGDPDQPKPAVHNTLPDLRDRLSRMHSGDVAQVLESLPPADRLLVWRQLREQRGGELLLALGGAGRAGLLARLAEEELRLAIGQLDGEALAALADELPPGLLQERALALPAEERRWLERVLGFREGTVGRLMSRKMVVAHDHLTLKEIVAGLQRLSAPPFGDTLFVTDQHDKLRGVVPLPWALLRAPEQPVSELMVTELLTFMPDETIRDAAPAFMRSGLLSAPVVDPQGALLGCLTVEKVMAYLRAERDEALLHFTGLPGGEELFTSGWQSARNRWRWLAITAFAALISAAVIGLFQTAIAQLVALAVLLPIVARLGATSGYQSSALVMRALALGPLGAGKGLHLLRKELGTGLLNGALLGVLVGAFVFALYSHAALAGVAAAALLLTLPSAALAGIGVPLLLDRLGRSPTRGVSVLISALTDSLGFFIFLGLATLFLP